MDARRHFWKEEERDWQGTSIKKKRNEKRR